MTALRGPVPVPDQPAPGDDLAARYLWDVVEELVRRELLVDGAIVHGDHGTVLFDVPATAAGPSWLPVWAYWNARDGWSVCTAQVAGAAPRRQATVPGGCTPAACDVADFVARTALEGP
ncbi:hypothetical protein [Pseudonocardia acidicola]|uniref:Uncharacterized protein n=1 Tax=Pseudonocardia acidicola TaxID=2724939 RepID=A0ABX1SAM3_9PSEU|nr:hypothetical protein [Pseudonocardia acidicola]NMH97617.1 hypothetical protein [Pseudonocardia acidicola]